jgi:glycosyltransferase involved in cell wall biosynthesis
VRRDNLATPVDFYRAVDGFVLTSIYEGMSLAVLEAMACDLPLILSDAPGNREFSRLPLSHLHTAPVGDVAAFTRAIGDWSVGQWAAAKPSNHRTVAIEQFDSRRSFGRVLSLYRKIALRRRASPAPAAVSSLA